MKIKRRFATSASWAGAVPTIRLPTFRGYAPYAIGFGVALLAGYLVAALILFRAPVFVTDATVPRVIGLAPDSARRALEGAELKSREAGRDAHPRAPAGQVVWQDPPPGTVVAAGTTVDLTLSAGPQRVPVPDVSGYHGNLARTLVEAAGLAVATESTQTAAPPGVVVNSRPPAGAALVPGARVTLVISRGAPTIPVPVIIGLTLEDARSALTAAGLALGASFYRTDPANPGTVIEQRPPSGTLAAPGTRIDIVLARRSPS